MDWLEVLQGVSIIIASGAVIRGVNAWHTEFIGRRRIQLAEDTLVLFYEAKDAIRQIRAPMSFGSEGRTREPGENETPEEKRMLDRTFVAIERFNGHKELFSKIHATRYRFMAQFGKDQVQAFADIHEVINKIIVKSQFLARYKLEVLHGQVLERHLAEHGRMIQEAEEIFWDMGEDTDPINIKVAAAIGSIEKICEPVLNKPSPLKNWQFWHSKNSD